MGVGAAAEHIILGFSARKNAGDTNLEFGDFAAEQMK